jgi:hypothetical protein
MSREKGANQFSTVPSLKFPSMRQQTAGFNSMKLLVYIVRDKVSAPSVARAPEDSSTDGCVFTQKFVQRTWISLLKYPSAISTKKSE